MTDNFVLKPDQISSSSPTCHYCGLPIDAETSEDEESDLEFCSEVCHTEHEETNSSLPDYKTATFFETGVSAIDASLPQGMPRNTLSVLSGETGTRIETVLIELAWRALERDEPVILVTVSDPPLTLLRQFLTLKWNVLPYLEEGHLQIIDCYTYRNSEDRDVVCSEWDAHLLDAAESGNSIQRVRDPTQTNQLLDPLRTTANKLAMDCKGTIIIDSLTELGTLIRPVRAYELIKNLRADYCKSRNVTVFCGAHYSGQPDEFPHEMEYLFDGIFDLSLDPKSVPGTLIKDFIVRKMRGVMTIREQYSFEYLEHAGMMLVDPAPETENIEDEKLESDSPSREDVVEESG